MKSDLFVKKITSCFLIKPEKYIWVKLSKIGQKLIIRHFFSHLGRKSKVIFFTKNNFWPSGQVKNAYLILSFWPFSAKWPRCIFRTWSENKKWFFSQEYHFSFSDWSILVSRRRCYSNNPKCFWNILLLRPRVKHFKTWFFHTHIGSPFMLW